MASRQRPSPPRYERRAMPPERASTGTFGAAPSNSYDPYYGRESRDPYTSPRSSGERVVPVSTETYRNGSLVSSSRPNNTYDPYSDSRRTSLPAAEPAPRRPAHTHSSGRNPPAVVHQNLDRPDNPSSRPSDRYDRGGYYITPASSGRYPHRKTYSTDESKRNRPDDRDRDAVYGREPPRREPRYHLTGPSKKDSEADTYPKYEYATPRDVFENTEPRQQTRRRGSVDAPSRDRPTSLMESYGPARGGTREMGPPPATRALERIKNGDGISRHESQRDPVRSPPRNRERARYGSFSEDDNYRVAQRLPRERQDSTQNDRDEPYSPTRSDYEDRQRWEDRDVANRGFGIRPASADHSRSREGSIDSRARFVAGEMPPAPSEYSSESRRDDRQREAERKQRDRAPDHGNGHERENDRDYDRDPARDRDLETTRETERDPPQDKSREQPQYDDDVPARDHRHAREREGERYQREPARTREKNGDEGSDTSRRERPREERPREERGATSVALPAAGIAAAAGAAVAHSGGARSERRGPDDERSRAKGSKGTETPPREEQRAEPESPDETHTRERHYVTKDDKGGPESAREQEADAPSLDPDEEFRRRIQQEAERAKYSKRPGRRPDDQQGEKAEASRHHRDDDDLESDGESEEREDVPRGRTVPPEDVENILDAPLTDEPAAVIENRENRVRIVEPPKEKDLPKGILRKPTERFPEYSDNVREGVAPHKDIEKPGVPKNAKWTKIARSHVNPQALEEAEERFEERQDFVIVLRAISKEEIQQLANRTKEIREEREQRHHHERRPRRRRDHDDDDEYDDDKR